MTNGPRATPQQDRSRVTVEKILAAADVEFAARGSSGVTTTQIAERAGVSVGALYRFFPDKQAIASALAERYLVDAQERFVPLLAAIDGPDALPDGLRPIVSAAAELALVHRGYYQLTREIVPGAAGSVGALVRSVIVDEFDELISRFVTIDAHRRRVLVSLVVETVRHTLATCTEAEPERTIVVEELTELVVTYARQRLSRPVPTQAATRPRRSARSTSRV